MNSIIPPLMIMWLPLSVSASHNWADIDLCEVYKDKLPPGLTLEGLPEAQSRGAFLLNRYCTQCHNLPGPDRHTSSEWQEVTDKMFMLMDVSSRFGGLTGKVEALQRQEQEIVRSYLKRHAAKSIVDKTADSDSNNGTPWLKRSLTLLPILLLTGLGLLRWRRNRRGDQSTCVID